MSKMNIIEAAEHFGISKEAIHNRIRRGSLESVVEDGVKFVIVDKNEVKKPRVQTRKTQTTSSDKYYQLLEEQNAKLQAKVEKLEDETRSLRDQKEQMLIDERHKIEQIYKDKDEQLKNILTSFKAQFMIASPKEQVEDEHLDAEIEEIPLLEEDNKKGVISLKKYLKDKKISDKKIQKIKDKFKKRAKKDERVIIIGKKYYLNLDKYDYKDLVK